MMDKKKYMKHLIPLPFRRLYNSFISYPPVKLGDYDSYWSKWQRTKTKEKVSLRKNKTGLVINEIDKTSKVFELGCGNGRTLKLISKKVECSGVDISKTGIEIALSEGLDVWVADITHKDFKIDPKYNMVVICSVLEHISNPEEVLKKSLEHNRKVMFTIPNTGYLPHRLRLLTGKFPVQWVYHPKEHLRYWTISDMKWWCRKIVKCKIIKIVPFCGIPILQYLLPNIFSKYIFVVVQKKQKQCKLYG